MILIIMHHYALYSGFQFSQDITINKMIINFFIMGGKIGVNVFILITGYFMINSKFKIQKVFNLLTQVLTYTLFFLIINLNNVSIRQIVVSILPVTYSQYGFITNYIIVYILSPYINIFIENIDKRNFRKITFVFDSY